MAKYRQPIISLIPGIAAAIVIIGLIVTALLALWQKASVGLIGDWLSDPYLWRIFYFTFYQALLSTLISVFFALILAKAMTQVSFKGKWLLLRLYTMAFVLPSLVLIIGIITIYGRKGWLATFLSWLNIDYEINIYGLSGILIAHVFYNLPFACRLFYQSLEQVPVEHKQLSVQLGLSYWQHFKLIEWPVLSKQILPTFGLIFLLCFVSFAVVLTLGGGPKSTTLEVAIYQAVQHFDLTKAVILSLFQLAFCLLMMLILYRFTPSLSFSKSFSLSSFELPISTWIKRLSYLIIIIITVFILIPIIAIIIEGILGFTLAQLNYNLLTAALTSICIAIGSGVFSLTMAILLLWTSTRLSFFQYHRLSRYLPLTGMLILVIPSMVLAAGFFLLFYSWLENSYVVAMLMMICNGLFALPFTLRILDNPTKDLTQRYYLLSQSLNINGWQYFRLIEFKALRAYFLFAFSFSCVISIGDFGVIALFGSQHLTTLPYYLYQQMAAHSMSQTAFTALVLLLLCLSIFLLAEQWRKQHD